MKNLPLLALGCVLSTTAMADMIQWHDESISLLAGTNYEVDASDQTTITLESAGGASWGDWYGFYDGTFYDNNSPDNFAVYGELSPRLSASKLSGTKVGIGAITDVSLALTWEMGSNAEEAFLYGIGLDLAIPGFTYFQANIYRRDGRDDGSNGYQFTPVWSLSYPVGKSNIVLDGYIDWVFSSDSPGFEENFHFNPQIKYDVGMALNGKQGANKLMAGIEYDYWSNKYGIPSGIPGLDSDQSAISLLVRYHF